MQVDALLPQLGSGLARDRGRRIWSHVPCTAAALVLRLPQVIEARVLSSCVAGVWPASTK